MNAIGGGYKGKPYAGGALLIRRPSDPFMEFDIGATSGWGALIQGPLEVQELRCKHNDLLDEPHVHRITSWLDDYLSRAHADPLLEEKAGARPQL